MTAAATERSTCRGAVARSKFAVAYRQSWALEGVPGMPSSLIDVGGGGKLGCVGSAQVGARACGPDIVCYYVNDLARNTNKYLLAEESLTRHYLYPRGI